MQILKLYFFLFLFSFIFCKFKSEKNHKRNSLDNTEDLQLIFIHSLLFKITFIKAGTAVMFEYVAIFQNIHVTKAKLKDNEMLR